MLTLPDDADEYAKALAMYDARACDLQPDFRAFELALAIDHVLSSDDSAEMFTNIGVVAHGPAHYVRS